jgi:hypothetical protein
MHYIQEDRTIYNILVCTSQETHYVSAQPVNAVQAKHKIAVYCENTKHINTLSVKGKVVPVLI